MATPTKYSVTLKEFMTSVVTQLRNNTGQTGTLGAGPSTNIINFMISWGHVEGGSVTNSAFFNPLNTKQVETGSVVFGTTAAGDGVQAYPDATTGEQGTMDALNNGNYHNLVHALSTNDEINLGFKPKSANAGNTMAGDIADELSVWVSGSNTLTSSSEQYIISIMQGAGVPNASVQGGTTQSSKAGESQSTIDKWGAETLGKSQTGTVASNDTSGFGAWTQNDFLKVAGGALLIMIASALFIKVQMPGSVVGKAIPSFGGIIRGK